MTDLQLAVEAAKLLGRWTLIADKHATGCACCPGLGDVAIDEVEASVLAWLRERHAFLQDRTVTGLLKDCIARSRPAAGGSLEPLFKDLDEALGHLEQVQRGL